MASAVKREFPELSSAEKTPNLLLLPIDISSDSDSDSSSSSSSTSSMSDHPDTTSFIQSLTGNFRNPLNNNSDQAAPPPPKKTKRDGDGDGSTAALGFSVNIPLTAAVQLTMARVLPDKTCVTQIIGSESKNSNNSNVGPVILRGCKQFWKAGDYEEGEKETDANSAFSTVGMDHARIHPKFLHSNATSHKWALGAMFGNAWRSFPS